MLHIQLLLYFYHNCSSSSVLIYH